MDTETRLEEDERQKEISGQEPAGQGKDQVDGPEKSAEGVVDEDWDGLVQKRGAKNIILENRRKAKEFADLTEKEKKYEEELATLKKASAAAPASAKQDKDKAREEARKLLPKEISDYMTTLEEFGYDQSFIDKQMNAVVRLASSIVDYRLRGADKILYKDDLDGSMDQLKKDDKYKFIMSKLETGLRSEMLKHPGESWKNIDFVKQRLGILIAENQEKLFGDTKGKQSPGESPTESEVEHGTGEGGKYTQKELDDYAIEMGVSITNPEIRRKVKEALLMKKKALASLKKEE